MVTNMKKNNKNVKTHTQKKNVSSSIFGYLMALLAVAAHVLIIALVVTSYRYYNVRLSAFVTILIALICVLAIIDILVYVSLKYKDIGYKIVNVILSIFMILIGSYGTYYVHRINKTVNNVIENDDVDQYETISGVFTYYIKNGSDPGYESIDDLKSKSNLKIGIMADDGSGTSTGALAKNILEEAGVTATYEEFTADTLLFEALVGDEGDIDVAVFPASLRQRLSSDNEVDYSEYLDNMVDFYSFEEKIKTGENENANKDLYTEPFNILLIGFAPEDEAQTIGLADTIIVATVNPKTFTVVLTSIARDSYVELTCQRGTRQKINAARSTSRQCLMDTVGELMDIDIDYYMEVNFTGVVDIVDALGGVVINSPVAFVGQTASGIRGSYTVYVPAGEYLADGEQALAFARERKVMPNGDFDRQQHQQEVIKQIVKKLLELNDVNKALAVMDAAGANLSTNLSLNQLTGIFNYLINHENTTGISTFEMIDIQNMRVTGYASWYYSYSMRLAQWIYKLYNGSITECQERIKDVLNDYSGSDIKQVSYQKYFADYPYDRGQLYSESFNEAQVHEKMPAFWANLTNMTYTEALAWAAENGVTLNVTFIRNDSSEYDASRDGQVLSQNPRNGALVSEYPSGSITVMGIQDGSYDPEFTIDCTTEEACVAFATTNGLKTSTEKVYDKDSSKNTKFAYALSSSGSKTTVKKSETLILYYYTNEMVVPSFSGYTYDKYVELLKTYGLTAVKSETAQTTTDKNLDGTIYSVSPEVGKAIKSGATVTITLYKYDSSITPHEHDYSVPGDITQEATCTEAGKQIYYCSANDGESIEKEIPAKGHSWVVTGDATNGYVRTCSVCNNVTEYSCDNVNWSSTQSTCTVTPNPGDGDGDGDGNTQQTQE